MWLAVRSALRGDEAAATPSLKPAGQRAALAIFGSGELRLAIKTGSKEMKVLGRIITKSFDQMQLRFLPLALARNGLTEGVGYAGHMATDSALPSLTSV
jgi:hypothetical protein